MDAKARRILIFDDGDGIAPEDVDAFVKAGASTVRDDGIQDPVRTPLTAGDRREAGSRFGLLDAPWGRYGIGRYSQLQGSTTKVKYTSVAKGVGIVVVITQDMGRMLHQKEISYDTEFHRVGKTREAAVCIANVNKAFNKKLGPTNWTCIEITGADESFFDDWKENRLDHLARLAEKYVLHVDGPSGAAVRGWLEGLGVVDGDASQRRLTKLIIDGADLGSSGIVTGSDVKNRVADLATFARARDNAQHLVAVRHLGLREAGGGGGEGDVAGAAHVSLYWPTLNGVSTMPQSLAEDRCLCFWNGLFLRDERLYPWFARPGQGRAKAVGFESKLDRRVTNLLFLESTRLFAPEIHKRHLRDGDPGYRKVFDPQPKDAYLEKLRKAHAADRLEWTKTYDEDESYPMQAEDDARFVAFRGSLKRRCGTLLYRGQEIVVGDYVSFEFGVVDAEAADDDTTRRGRRRKPDCGYGRVVAFYCDPQDASAPGFVVTASPLLPPHDVDFGDEREALERLVDAGPAHWWHECFVSTASAAIVDAVDPNTAEAEASKKFPSKVHLLKCGTFAVDARQQAWHAEPFADFDSTLYAHTPPPPLHFGVLQGPKSKTTRAPAAALKGISLDLVASRPDGEADEVVCAAQECNGDGIFVLEHTKPLDAVGAWTLRARLTSSAGKIWTRLSEVERGPRGARAQVPFSLDNLCGRRDEQQRARGAPATSRDVAVKLNPSEPVEVRVVDFGKRCGPLELGEALPPVVLAFHDARGEKAVDASMQVDAKSYDPRGGESRFWLEIDGNDVALDATKAKLRTEGSDGTRLAVHGLLLPEDAVHKATTLPCDARLHCRLQPIVAGDERWTFVSYDVDARGTPTALGRPFESLADLDAHVNGLGQHWLVPRTVAPLDVALSSRPAALALVEPSALTGLTPRGKLVCGFEVVAASGHALGDFENFGFEVGLVVDDGTGVSVKPMMKTLASTDGVLRQEIFLDAPFGWSGLLRFAVADCECIVDAATVDRTLAVAVLTEAGLGDQPAPDAPAWKALDASATACLDAVELNSTWLKVEVRDETGAVDDAFQAAAASLFLVNGDAGSAHKFMSNHVLDRGAAVFSLAALASRASGPVADARARGAFALEAVVKEAGGDKHLLLRAPTVTLAFKAGDAAAVLVEPQEVLAIGDGARAWPLRVVDDAGVALGEAALAHCRVSLTCADGRATLEGAPTGAPVWDDALKGAALPGGWNVRGAFQTSSNDAGPPMAVDVVVSVATPQGATLEVTASQHLLPGRIAEVRANAEAVSVPRGERFPSPTWTCYDASGNVCDNPMNEITCELVLSSGSHDELTLDRALASKKRKKKDAKGPPTGVVDERGVLSFDDLVADTKDKVPLLGSSLGQLKPSSSSFGADVVVDPVSLSVTPDPTPVTVRVFRRDASHETETAERKDGELPDCGCCAGKALELGSEWSSVELTSGSAVLEIPAGAQVGDVARFRGFDEANRPVKPEALAETLKVKITGRPKWYKATTILSETSKLKCFVDSSHDAPATFWLGLPARGGATGQTTVFAFDVVRVPGDCMRLTLETAPTPRHSLLSQTASPESPRAKHRAASLRRYFARAFDDDDEKRGASCDCVARLTCDADDTFDDGAIVTTLTQPGAPVGVSLAQWFADDGDDGEKRVDAVGVDGVLVDLKAGRTTVLEVALVDATNDRIPLDDAYFLTTIKLFRDGMEDDVDGVANVDARFPLSISNARGRAERDAAEQLKGREERERRDDLAKKRSDVTKLESRLRELSATLTKQEAAAEARDNAVAREASLRRDLEALEATEATLVSELEAAEAAPATAEARPAALATDRRRRDELDAFRAKFKRALAREHLEDQYYGFLSDLATVADDADAACLAHVCRQNSLYVESHRAVRVAQDVATKEGVVVDVMNLACAKEGPKWDPRRTPEALMRKVAATDDAGADLACAALVATPDAMRRVFAPLLQAYRALIFPSTAALDAAEASRDASRADFCRVARDAPSLVLRPGGRARVGERANKPPPFAFGGPPPETNDDLKAVLEAKLEQVRDDKERAARDLDDVAAAAAAASDSPAVDPKLRAAVEDARRTLDEKKSEVRALQADLRRRDSGASQRTDKKRPNAIADLARKKAKAATKSAPSADNRKRDRDATQDSDVDSQKTDDEDDDDDDGTRLPRRRLSIQV